MVDHVLGLVAGLALGTATSAFAAPLSPNQGSVTITGTLEQTDGAGGAFDIQAVLNDGDFSGAAKVTIAGEVVEGALYKGRSYFENGRCIFYVESGRSRAEVRGPCDTTRFGAQGGTFDVWSPGSGGRVGKAEGRIVVGAPGRTAQTGVLPTSRLACVYQEINASFTPGQATQLGQIISQGALTLRPAGTYVAGASGTPGRFTKSGNKLRFTSGPWAGAVATLEPDRSGQPSLTFDREENKSAGRVLPQTIRCTQRR